MIEKHSRHSHFDVSRATERAGRPSATATVRAHRLADLFPIGRHHKQQQGGRTSTNDDEVVLAIGLGGHGTPEVDLEGRDPEAIQRAAERRRLGAIGWGETPRGSALGAAGAAEGRPQAAGSDVRRKGG
jgi:hypothetical protein